MAARATTLRTPHALARALWGRRPAVSPVVADGCFIGALFVLVGAHLFEVRGSALVWAVQAGLFVPLAWRRRAPVVVFGAVAAAAFVQWLTGVLLPEGDFALLIAFYSVAAYASLRLLLLSGLVMEVGVALATGQWAPPGHDVKMFVLLSGTTTAAGVLGLQIRTRRAYLASLRDRAERAERERDQRARLAVTAERARISREVHDIVTHSLSVMVALTDGAACTMPAGRSADAVTRASDIGRQAIGEMRRLLGVMRDGEGAADADDAAGRHPQPGLGQLDGLLAEVRSAGLAASLTVAGTRPALSAGAELAVYRVVQEALTNVRKHAPAGATASVRLRYAPSSVEVEIVDDGSPAIVDGGSPAAAAVPPHIGGHGIAGMRERAAVYGGTVEAGPVPGGWRVHAGFGLSEAGDPLPTPRSGPRPHADISGAESLGRLGVVAPEREQ